MGHTSESQIIDVINNISAKQLNNVENYIFEIPEFQRPYQWGKHDIERVFTDIDEILSIKQNGEVVQPKYMSHLIIHFDEINKKLNIIDGQQRLTTFMLLYKVILDYCKNNKIKIDTNLEQKLKNFCYFNYKDNTLKFVHQKNTHFIVKQYVYLNLEDLTQKQKEVITKELEKEKKLPSDDEYINHFKYEISDSEKRKLLEITYSRNFRPKVSRREDYYNIVNNYKIIEKYIQSKGEILRNSTSMFINSCFAFEVSYKIDDNFDRAFEIFVSLNSTGVKLSHFDLIKSYVLNSLKKECNEDDYHNADEKWKEIFENKDVDFSNKEAIELIKIFLQIHHEKYDVKNTNLYSMFKGSITTANIENTMVLLKLYKEIYIKSRDGAFNLSFDNPRMSERLKPLNEKVQLLFKSDYKSTIPLVMYACIEEKENYDNIKYLINHAIWCPVAFRSLGNDRAEKLEALLKVYIDNKTMDDKIPKTHFNTNIKEIEYKSKQTINEKIGKYVLNLLDTKTLSGNSKIVHLEHIYSKSPREETKKEFIAYKKIDSFDTDEYTDFINVFGNYILLSEGQNQKVKNKDYYFKKEIYSKFKDDDQLKEFESSIFDEFEQTYVKNDTFGFDKVEVRTKEIGEKFISELEAILDY